VLSYNLSMTALTHTHRHARAYARAHARAHAHVHAHTHAHTQTRLSMRSIARGTCPEIESGQEKERNRDRS